MSAPTFHITTSDGSTVFPDIEIVEKVKCAKDFGVVPNDFRINGVSMHVSADEPIVLSVGPEELTSVTVTLFAKSVSVRQEVAA